MSTFGNSGKSNALTPIIFTFCNSRTLLLDFIACNKFSCSFLGLELEIPLPKIKSIASVSLPNLSKALTLGEKV